MKVDMASAPARRRVTITPRAAILALVVTALVFYLVVPLRAYVTQRNRLDRLERQTQLLEQQNAKLQQQVALLHNPSYLERIARECLGMVKKGEIGFIIVPKSGSPQPANC